MLAQTDPATEILLDGLNIAYWCGSPPQLRLPLSLLAALLNCGYKVTLILDANAPYLFTSDAQILQTLKAHPDLCHISESGQTADAVLLARAKSSNGRIISRDHYKDYHRRYRKIIHDAERLLTGFVKDEHVHISALNLSAELADSCQMALEWVIKNLE